MDETPLAVTVACLVALAAFDTLVLRAAFVVFQGRQNRFFTRFAGLTGWALCFGVLAGANLLAAVPYGVLPAIVAWWWASLELFGFTIRQTIKLGIVFTLFQLALVVAIAHLTGGGSGAASLFFNDRVVAGSIA